MDGDGEIDDIRAQYPCVDDWIAMVSEIDPDAAETVFAPETVLEDCDSTRIGEGYWVGAPALYDAGEARYLAVRERTRDERGRAITVYAEQDDTYTDVLRISSDDLDVVSMERPSFCDVQDNVAMYIPVDDGDTWKIQRLDPASTPAALDPDTADDVLTPDNAAGPVKDPVVWNEDGTYNMVYSCHDGVSEQAHYATGQDGTTFVPADSNPILPRQHWHNHHTRITAVEPFSDGWLLTYEGSGTDDYGNTWNLRTGAGVTADFETVIDLSPDKPLVQAAPAEKETGLDVFGTVRYLAVTESDLFFEVARSDGAFELRRSSRTR